MNPLDNAIDSLGVPRFESLEGGSPLLRGKIGGKAPNAIIRGEQRKKKGQQQGKDKKKGNCGRCGKPHPTKQHIDAVKQAGLEGGPEKAAAIDEAISKGAPIESFTTDSENRPEVPVDQQAISGEQAGLARDESPESFRMGELNKTQAAQQAQQGDAAQQGQPAPEQQPFQEIGAQQPQSAATNPVTGQPVLDLNRLVQQDAAPPPGAIAPEQVSQQNEAFQPQQAFQAPQQAPDMEQQLETLQEQDPQAMEEFVNLQQEQALQQEQFGQMGDEGLNQAIQDFASQDGIDENFQDDVFEDDDYFGGGGGYGDFGGASMGGGGVF